MKQTKVRNRGENSGNITAEKKNQGGSNQAIAFFFLEYTKVGVSSGRLWRSKKASVHTISRSPSTGESYPAKNRKNQPLKD